MRGFPRSWSQVDPSRKYLSSIPSCFLAWYPRALATFVRQYPHTLVDDGELATHMALEDLNATHVHVCVTGVAQELADLADSRVVRCDHSDVSCLCRFAMGGPGVPWINCSGKQAD